jgi:hypothetical protein
VTGDDYVGRVPAHEIGEPPPKCPAGTPLGLVRDRGLDGMSTVLLPPFPKLQQFQGRLYFAPVGGSGGRPLVARTSRHENPNAEGAFASPQLCDHLGAKSTFHDFVCVRPARWWEPLRYEPGVRSAILLVVANLVTATLVATVASLKDLGTGSPFLAVAAVLALTLWQSALAARKALADTSAPRWLGSGILIGVVALFVAAVIWVHAASAAGVRRLPILEVWPQVGGRSLQVDVGTCGGRSTATATESPTRIVIGVTATGAARRASCADAVFVDLSAPVGRRLVLDRNYEVQFSCDTACVRVPAQLGQIPPRARPATP